MKEQYTIKEANNLIEYLSQNGKEDIITDADYQLESNLGFVYNLKNGQVIFLPNDLKSKGLLIENKSVFKKMVKDDFLPIEDESKNLFESEIKQIQTFHKEISNYQKHLNKTLYLDFKELN